MKPATIYTNDWERLGIVSLPDIERDQCELDRGEDPCPEHYRWRSFVKFIHAQEVQGPSLLRSLYELGKADSNPALGESIMAVILRRDDSPRDLYNDALNSSSEHLRRIALSRISASLDFSTKPTCSPHS